MPGNKGEISVLGAVPMRNFVIGECEPHGDHSANV